MPSGDDSPDRRSGDQLLVGLQVDAQGESDPWEGAAHVGGSDGPAGPGDAGGQGRRLRVLVVDDNQDAADSLGAVTELLDCEVRVCYDGATALAAIQGELPDVLLLDINMPRVSGLEVAAGARAIAGRRPLLLVATTALGSLEDRTETALGGFHYHLIKPVGMETLRQVLDRFREIRAHISQFIR